MANNVICNLVADIRGGFFAIIADEYTDVSNKEQLTICIRWIDKSLEVHKDFLKFFIGTGALSYPTTPQDHYRRVYFEAIDLMVNAIDLRFNQASYRVYEKMESFLVKCLNCQDYSTELRYLETNYKDDVNVGTLNAQLEIFKLLMKEGEFTCLDDI